MYVVATPSVSISSSYFKSHKRFQIGRTKIDEGSSVYIYLSIYPLSFLFPINWVRMESFLGVVFKYFFFKLSIYTCKISHRFIFLSSIGIQSSKEVRAFFQRFKIN